MNLGDCDWLAADGAVGVLALSLLLPFQGVSDGTRVNPGCRSLCSLALGWGLLPLRGVGGGFERRLGAVFQRMAAAGM